ncbi:uncharacterized protein LOC117588470 [Drosophila guanche]|uniref:uncharacterized protein LOC117588470 n=1 Tax=Drosophila guanche TaxID=7266 RepID=UPI001471097B|nr:uncharacterized protein LOC117588470 [Drosophila guanche]
MFECTRCRHRKGALSSEPEFELVGPKMGREGRHIRGLSDTCQVCHCLTFFVQAAAEDRARSVSLFEFHGIPRPPLPPSSQHIPQRSVNPSSCSPGENAASDSSDSSDSSESNPNVGGAAAGVDLVQIMQKLTNIERRLDELVALKGAADAEEQRDFEEQKNMAKVPARVREAEPGEPFQSINH